MTSYWNIALVKVAEGMLLGGLFGIIWGFFSILGKVKQGMLFGGLTGLIWGLFLWAKELSIYWGVMFISLAAVVICLKFCKESNFACLKKYKRLM